MNSKITLDQAIQQRENIMQLVYDNPSCTLLEYFMKMLRSWDKEILEHYEYRELNELNKGDK